MDLNKLKTFYYVVKAGTISGAGTYFNINQSSISRQISSLEKSLGVRLLRRSHDGVELTKSGEILYEQVEKIMSLTDLAHQSIKSHKEGLDGKLILGTTHALSAWLADYLPAFFEENPKVQLHIDAGNLNYDFDKVDAVLGTLMSRKPNVIQVHIYTFHLQLFASKEYLEKYGTPRTPEDLRKHRLIALDNKLEYITDTNWILRAGNIENKPLKPFMTLQSTSHTILKLAKAGLGIVQLGKDHPQIEGVDLIPVLPQLKGPSVDIYYIYPKKVEHNINIQKFKNFLHNTFKKNDS